MHIPARTTWRVTWQNVLLLSSSTGWPYNSLHNAAGPDPSRFSGRTSLVGLQTSISIQTSSQSACHPRQHPLQPCKLAWPQDISRCFKMFQDVSRWVSGSPSDSFWLKHQTMRSKPPSWGMNPKASHWSANGGNPQIPTDSNRFETGQASAVTRANGNSSGSFSSSAGLARIVMSASNLLPQSTGYHWISLDITGYHWILNFTVIRSDTIWYNLILIQATV